MPHNIKRLKDFSGNSIILKVAERINPQNLTKLENSGKFSTKGKHHM